MQIITKSFLSGLWITISFTLLNSQQTVIPYHQEILIALSQSGVSKRAMAELKVSDRYHSRALNVEHVFYHQFYHDVPIENAILNSGFRNGNLMYANHTFVNNIQADPSDFAGMQSPTDGLKSALIHISRQNVPMPDIKVSQQSDKGHITKVTFDKGTISQSDIEVSLVWVREGKSLRLCWQSIIDVADSHNEYYHIMTDARTGNFVKKYNLVVECTFEHFECMTHQYIRPIPERASPNSALLANTYNVFDLPLESPNHGSRSVTTSPWNRPGVGNHATTLGWHDNGSSTYTITRGNNVYAYEDQDNNNIAGYSPDGGTSLDFNYTLDFGMPPENNMDASITNLFHTCNLTHDILYQYGFDEGAGNFQTNNLGRGGAGADHILAEAFDGSGTNNANFSTPSDGGSGRMQMFLWSSVPPPTVTVNSPVDLSSPMYAKESSFSINNSLVSVGPVTGDVALVNDGTGLPSEGCNPLTNGATILGKIALIDRGNCNFTDKVKNAQNVGAIAAIVINNNPGQNPITMGGTDNTITIPAVMISYEHGQEIKTALMTHTVNMTMEGEAALDLDGSFDNGIIIHEYGHGVSNRLTGGPGAAGCLQNDEQMGEGWSDYLTLMLTTDWTSAISADNRGIGTYASAEPPEGTGIRTYPYTTNTLANPFTYADVANAPLDNTNNPSVHYIGSIWATMLWDMTWNIIDMEGASNDIYHGTGGNNIALQLVMDGMKLQPCSPGFEDGRDAILLADELNYGGQYKCAIWEAFAGRGLGFSASQGSSSDHTDGVVANDLPSDVILKRTISKTSTFEGELINITVEGTCECVPQNNYQVRQDIDTGMTVDGLDIGSVVGGQVVSSITNLGVLETVKLKFDARMDLCSATTPTTLFSDDVEGSAMFTATKNEGQGNVKWTTNSLANSPTTSWYAEDYNKQVDLLLTQNSPILISGPVKLSFYHRFETEATWDGGVVEISTNGGTTWIDLGPYFIENGYPSAFAGNGSSALAGREAFTGDSDELFSTVGFVRTTADLADFDGESVQIRFRFATDNNTGGTGLNGWYVDDIAFTRISGMISKAYGYQNAVLQKSLSKSIEVNAVNSSILYVDNSATGSKYGADWTNAYLSLQDALKISDCRGINTIYLAEGNYLPYDQRDSSFVIKSDVAILGGFPAGGSAEAIRSPTSNLCILSGDIGTPGNDGDNNYHVVYCGAGVTNAVLDGVIIEKGKANGGGIDNEGAAILVLGSITLKDVTTRNNTGNSDIKSTTGANIDLQGNNKIKN